MTHLYANDSTASLKSNNLLLYLTWFKLVIKLIVVCIEIFEVIEWEFHVFTCMLCVCVCVCVVVQKLYGSIANNDMRDTLIAKIPSITCGVCKYKNGNFSSTAEYILVYKLMFK